MKKKKDDNKENNQNIKEKFNKILELPKELILDLPRTIILGNEQILVENYKGIIEYENNMVRLNNNITIYGTKLNVEEINFDEIFITGKITSVEFEDET
jgi:sporulation protein YqfC